MAELRRDWKRPKETIKGLVYTNHSVYHADSERSVYTNHSVYYADSERLFESYDCHVAAGAP